MTAHDVRIELSGHGAGSVVVDGIDLSRAVRSLSLEGEVGSRPVLRLELCVHDVSTVSQVQILIPDDTADALVALGWTPPDGKEASDAPAHD